MRLLGILTDKLDTDVLAAVFSEEEEFITHRLGYKLEELFPTRAVKELEELDGISSRWYRSSE